jgi:hypothetical protein
MEYIFKATVTIRSPCHSKRGMPIQGISDGRF